MRLGMVLGWEMGATAGCWVLGMEKLVPGSQEPVPGAKYYLRKGPLGAIPHRAL